MACSRPPSGMIYYNNGGEPDNSASVASSNKQQLQQKMQRQRLLSLERQRAAAKSQFAGVKAQEGPGAGSTVRSASQPRLLNMRDGKPVLAGAVESGTTHDPSGKPSPRSGVPFGAVDQAVEDARQLTRCQTADSGFSSMELTEGDGRPGFERCGGRATAEQQGVNSKAPLQEHAKWDLKVNVTSQSTGSAVTTEGTSENQARAGGKKWWNSGLPFRGNRGASGGENLEDDNVAPLQRADMRTPDSTDRTFHRPNERAPARGPGRISPSFGRPPVPGRRGTFEDIMPGAIEDSDVADPRPMSGGSADGRSPIVPTRCRSPGTAARAPSPSRVSPTMPSASGVAFGGVSAICSSKSPASSRPPCPLGQQADSNTDKEVCVAQSGGPSKSVVSQVEAFPETPRRDASPVPHGGESEKKRGGRRGWRPWRGGKSDKDDFSESEIPKQEAVTTLNEVCPFSADD